jgi:SulP family sulfate permease
VEAVRIDVGCSHIWDLTGVGSVDTGILKFRR